MKTAVFVGFVVFCSMLPCGAFLKCSECSSDTSFVDCQKNAKLMTCPQNDSCYQLEINLVGSDSFISFSKGCLASNQCDSYREGNAGICNERKNDGYTGDCKGSCCNDRDDCNGASLLKNSQSVFIISVMVLLSGLALTAVNTN